MGLTPTTEDVHPERQVLDAYAHGTLGPEEREAVQRHLERCVVCSDVARPGSLSEQTPSVDVVPLPAEPEPPPLTRGSLLGRYVVLDVLGAGGMGEVYAAFDPELDRKVALKLVKARTRSTSSSDANAQTRLLREAQAMAKLAHPNVVSIYDVGEIDKRVFLALELVTGTTLTQWCDVKPRTWRETVATFIDAGRGLAAAHQAGMVHRDFKPDNVLIGADGRVRVSDFGLARATDSAPATPALSEGAVSPTTGHSGPGLLSAEVTQAATVLGTPGYMAPEQFGGSPADAKSDQFSFCVALYKCLYRQPPFVGHAGVGSLIRAVKAGEVQPPPPGSRVPQWVHRVVLRGLSVAPEQRFGSLDELLLALQADPWAKRQKTFVAAGVAAVLVLVVALGVTFGRQRRCTGAEQKMLGVWDAERQRAIAQAFEKSEVSYASDAWHLVQTSLDRYAQEWVDQHTSTCEATWVRGEQSDAVLTLRMQCLNERLDELRSLTELLTHADVDTVKAATRSTGALTDLSRCTDVEALERRMPLPKNAEEQARIERAQHALNEATSLFTLGKYQQALPRMEAVEAEAQRLGYTPLQAQATKWLFRVNGRLSRFERIKELAFETVRLAELAGDDATRFEATAALAQVGDEFGEPVEQMIMYCTLAEHILGRLKDPDWYRAKLAVVESALFIYRGRFAEGRAVCERGLAMIAKSTHTDLDEARESLLDNMADALRGEQQIRKALSIHLSSLELEQKRLGPDHPDVAHTQSNIGSTYVELNEPKLALPYIEQALKVRVSALGHDHVLVADTLKAKGDALHRLGELEAAELVLREGLAIDAKVAPDNPSAVALGAKLGENLLAQGRLSEALAVLNQAQEVATRIDTIALDLPVSTGLVLEALDRRKEAETVLNQAVAKLNEAPTRDSQALSRARSGLARLWWVRGDKKAAREAAEAALADLAHVEGDTSERVATLKQWLASHPAP